MLPTNTVAGPIQPIATILPSATSTWTPTILSPTPTFTLTAIASLSRDPFGLAAAGIVATVSPHGCATSEIAGHVFDPLGKPIPYLPVVLGGVLDGKDISQEAITGFVQDFGEGAYLFTIGTKPIPSENTVWVQLLDANHQPISEKFYLTTYEGCDRNLILLDFQQRSPS